jgi:V8-like Glu-specific endopeptidase
MLYSTDTVGGNSGSPVLNADGEFVGINFDRQRQGLMNEFKWSKDYSRSIATDVRLILWLMGEYDGASDLVQEMTG